MTDLGWWKNYTALRRCQSHMWDCCHQNPVHLQKCIQQPKTLCQEQASKAKNSKPGSEPTLDMVQLVQQLVSSECARGQTDGECHGHCLSIRLHHHCGTGAALCFVAACSSPSWCCCCICSRVAAMDGIFRLRAEGNQLRCSSQQQQQQQFLELLLLLGHHRRCVWRSADNRDWRRK